MACGALGSLLWLPMTKSPKRKFLGLTLPWLEVSGSESPGSSLFIIQVQGSVKSSLSVGFSALISGVP